MAIPAQPVLTTYNGNTHVINGSAEAATSVAIFDGGLQFGSASIAAGDGSFSIAIGDLTPGQFYNFIAVAFRLEAQKRKLQRPYGGTCTLRIRT